MDLTGFSIEIFKRLDSWLSPQLASVEKRLDKLEQGTKATLADSYQGTFRDGRQYERGNTLSHAGSLWLCMTETCKKPGGDNSGWRMICKRGQDAPK